MDFQLRFRAQSGVVLIILKKYLLYIIFVRRPLQHGPAGSPRTSIYRVVSDIDMTICLPFKSGSTPLIDGTEQHDSPPFRLTYIKQVADGLLVLFTTFWS